MRSQRGMIVLWAAIVLALVGFTWILGVSNLQAQAIANRQSATRAAYLRQSAEAVAAWYAENQASVDATAAAPAVADILARAGVVPRYGLRTVASQRIVQGELAYHVLVLWIPGGNPDPSAFDVATGVFSPGPAVPYEVVSGAGVQAKAVQHTRRVLTLAAAQLEQYFAARMRVGGGDITVNHFRPDSTCVGAAGTMPCVDAYTDVSLIDWRDAGVDELPLTDAWGQVLQVSNLADSSTTNPPYSMVIRSVAPWGTVLLSQAVQRL